MISQTRHQSYPRLMMQHLFNELNGDSMADNKLILTQFQQPSIESDESPRIA
jgi:hypothetical protein